MIYNPDVCPVFRYNTTGGQSLFICRPTQRSHYALTLAGSPT
jgi:hypothetical protein